MFAKLYETEEFGQILIKLDQNDECKPEVRIYFEPKGLGVCSNAVGYNDSVDGWNKAENYFNEIDRAIAMHIVNGVIQLIDQKLTS